MRGTSLPRSSSTKDDITLYKLGNVTVNLNIMVILLFIGKLANSRESVDLVESFNSGDCGESEDCCESSDSEKIC